MSFDLKLEISRLFTKRLGGIRKQKGPKCAWDYDDGMSCNEDAETEPDKTQPSKLVVGEDGDKTFYFPSKKCSHGLCYYHRKKTLGRFNTQASDYQPRGRLHRRSS